MSGYILVMIVGIAVSGVAALWVRSSYSKYSKKMSASGLTGAQTARMILDRNNCSTLSGAQNQTAGVARPVCYLLNWRGSISKEG